MVGLPLLNAMLPSVARAQAAGSAAAKRLFVFHFPTGVNKADWRPSATGGTWATPPSMTAFDTRGIKGDVNVLSGINNQAATRSKNADPAFAGHTPAIGCLLTGKFIPKTENTITTGVSVDQLAARTLGANTKVRSLVLGTDTYFGSGGESGWSNAYRDSISFEVNQMQPKMLDPAAVFDRLFAGASTTTTTATDAEAAKRRANKKSVLDYGLADAQRLSPKLGTEDRARLDEYMTGVRELERQIDLTATTPPAQTCAPGTRPASSANVDTHQDVATLPTRVKQMLDLAALAFQCDATRVATLSVDFTVTWKHYTFIDPSIGEYHTEVTHHPTSASLAMHTKVVKWFMDQYAYFVAKLKAMPEGSSNVLANSAVLGLTELGDSSAHTHNDLPIVLAGKGGGLFTTGRHIAYQNEDICNLHIALLAAVGINVSTFGDHGNHRLAI